MMAGQEADYLVVGAGCAGLSLAVHLLEHGPPGRRILLLEPRTFYERDRTFCFWQTAEHPFVSCATHRWARWRVQARGRAVVRGSHRHPYLHVPADAFYREAIRRIESSPCVELRLGVGVEAVHTVDGSVVAQTSQGEIRAALAFDGRPGRPTEPPPGEHRLQQHFLGWHVRTDRDAFDPDEVVLMDFRIGDGDAIHFMYVLPFGPREALVEDTWFSARPYPVHRYEGALRDYLARLLDGDGYEVLRSEGGILPMTTERAPRRRQGRVYRLGLAAGLGKPSSGYAFPFIQRDSAELARRLKRRALPDPPTTRTARSAALDRIFLAFLARHPERAPEIFLRLFERTPPASLVRFLSETSTPRDELAVLRALPPAPLLAEAIRSPGLWIRRA